MTKQELEKYYIQKGEFTFTPRFTIAKNIVTNEDEEREAVLDFTITATAEEVYQEYLAQQNQTPQPTESEMIMLAIAELDAQRELDKLETLETQLAIAELTETILGGV